MAVRLQQALHEDPVGHPNPVARTPSALMPAIDLALSTEGSIADNDSDASSVTSSESEDVHTPQMSPSHTPHRDRDAEVRRFQEMFH